MSDDIPITAAILLHLEKYSEEDLDEYAAPYAMTARGIGDSVNRSRDVTDLYLKRLLKADMIVSVRRYPRDKPENRNTFRSAVYYLTTLGRERAQAVRVAVAAERAAGVPA